jgi:hypothetical protein
LGRLAWVQLRFRSARTVALPAGMPVAATAFTVLTGAALGLAAAAGFAACPLAEE